MFRLITGHLLPESINDRNYKYDVNAEVLAYLAKH
jgi:hypothetical protein